MANLRTGRSLSIGTKRILVDVGLILVGLFVIIRVAWNHEMWAVVPFVVLLLTSITTLCLDIHTETKYAPCPRKHVPTRYYPLNPGKDDNELPF